MMSIRTKVTMILIVLSLFTVVVVGVNLYTYEALKGDAPSINLAEACVSGRIGWPGCPGR